jgi:outer membrane lipoprotein SlyB
MRGSLCAGAAVLTMALAAGCASYPADREPVYEPSRPGWSRAEYGYVANIQQASGGRQGPGGGAVIGGVVGAVVGNQVGRQANGPDGQVVGTIVGAVGGALIGHEIERSNRDDDSRLRVTVQLDRGGRRDFDFDRLGDLRIGDRVRIDNGRIYRF